MNYSLVIHSSSIIYLLTLKLLILLFQHDMKRDGKKLKMLITARIIHLRITYTNNKTIHFSLIILSYTKMCFRCTFILNDYP